MTDINTISAEDFTHILANPGAQLGNESGSCTLHYAAGDNEFVMMGPTGVHSLYAGATDRKRLNAHWLVFSAN